MPATATRSYADFSNGDKIVFIAKSGGEFKATYVGYNEEKGRARIQKDGEDKVVLVEIDQIKKRPGRPKMTEAEKAAKAKERAKQTTDKSPAKKSEPLEEFEPLSAGEAEEMCETLAEIRKVLRGFEARLLSHQLAAETAEAEAESGDDEPEEDEEAEEEPKPSKLKLGSNKKPMSKKVKEDEEELEDAE